MQTKAVPRDIKWIKAAMTVSDQSKETKLLSPCVSICQMDAFDEVCVGCYRTRAEIASWPSMDQDDQMLLLDILRDRRAKATGVRRRPSRRNVKRLGA